jgi:hypothetical protein
VRHVHLHIDWLVLRGFRAEDRGGIAAGIRQELSRLFSDYEAAQALAARGDASRLRIGSVQINPETTPQGVGTQLARGIGTGMKK